jgi:glucosamine--fructose-6-phosphate aminotransferase (isomerizing)
MCGIVGYVGPRVAQEFLIEGLRRLEYRGYDSAGTATIDPNYEFQILKSVGRISGLAAQIATHPCRAGIGIGHTRWATHGPATVTNAHPHIGGEEQLVVVHNGVIENYNDLKSRLQKKGYQFVS